uniref:uncharacterized protein n=1 Tax=Semicossyphus pulcher TaxID=241346 RepID=UPI0037E7002A
MNLLKNKALHPHLRDEEALVVENAIRLAVDSIINVLYGVNSARTREYQRMVADRDKEIKRLECRLTEMEHEQQVLRRQGCTCELFEKEHSLVGGSQSSGDPQGREQGGFEPSCIGTEMTAGQQECEMSISFGLFARPPSHVSSQSHESALPSSPSRLGVDQTCTSRSSESSGVSDAARNLLTSPSSSVVVKEEPCDMDTVLIKWELSEERFMEGPESTSSLCQDIENPSVTKILENRDRRELQENAHAEPGGHIVTEGEHLRNSKKSVPMSELPEEAQRLKRAAWRAASKRYYARKVARQQANPLRPAPFPHITDSRYSHPISFVDKRRRMLISELPEEFQTQRREAWRAASRRYYARKVARHQTDPTQYLRQNREPSGETLGPDRGGGHTNSGGIMCS